MITAPLYDVLILGSGAAGLSLALRLPRSFRIAVVSKRELSEGATAYAQGGISAVLDESDSLESHIHDTLAAGAGLCHRDVVGRVVGNARECIEWLYGLGVEFTRTDPNNRHSRYHLSREGGHSHRRVVHSADATGRAVAATLERHIRCRDNVCLLPDHIAVDLITGKKWQLDTNRCLGVYLLDRLAERVIPVLGRVVVLATGGAGKAYLYTSTPDVATGDGIAMAWRAGCRVANMEFMQFHPTCLYHPEAKSFLISEAVRGEGAQLTLPDGRRFMPQFDPRGELAPRDIVARAIDHEMKRLGLDCVFLDITHKKAALVEQHFPNIHSRLLSLGLDMTRQPIPVVPAAHYTCGGVVTDCSGRTDLPGLYAIGEVAFTGLHGANRMASNSLLECLAFARFAAEDIERSLPPAPLPSQVREWDESRVTDSDEEVVVSHNWQELRRLMWDYVGIVRTDKRLQRARRRVELLRGEIAEYYGHFRVTSDLIELRNLVEVADLIIRCAMTRKESRGLHFSLDYRPPIADHIAANTILVPDNLAEGFMEDRLGPERLHRRDGELDEAAGTDAGRPPRPPDRV